jgi:hypothetical protein
MNKKEIINKLINFVYKISNKTNLSINSLSILMRSYHLSAPIVLMLLVFYSNIYVSTLSALFMLHIIIGFIYFNACYLSLVEKHFFDDDFIITDPILEILKMEKTKKKRFIVTYIVGITYSIIFFLIYYLRFFT